MTVVVKVSVFKGPSSGSSQVGHFRDSDTSTGESDALLAEIHSFDITPVSMVLSVEETARVR